MFTTHRIPSTQVVDFRCETGKDFIQALSICQFVNLWNDKMKQKSFWWILKPAPQGSASRAKSSGLNLIIAHPHCSSWTSPPTPKTKLLKAKNLFCFAPSSPLKSYNSPWVNCPIASVGVHTSKCTVLPSYGELR